MRKSKLRNGTPFFGIKVEHFVTAKVFATALADHCWTKSINFNPNMQKSEAIGILKKGLHGKGNDGEIADGQFEGADEDAFNAWNDPYEQAVEWVLKNYPYLSTQ